MKADSAPAIGRSRPVLKTCLAIILVSLLGLGGYIYLGHRSLAQLRKELIVQGEILDWRLLGTNAAPRQDNGMPAIVAAAAALPEIPRGLVLSPAIRPGVRVDVLQIAHYPVEIQRWDGTNLNRHWLSNLWTELGSYIEPHRHIWRQAVDATTNETMLHEIDWARGRAMSDFPQTRLKPLGNWSRAAIAYDLHRGAYAQAMETATNTLQVLRLTGGVPTVVGELVRHVNLSVIDSTIWWLLNQPWPDHDLANLQHSLEAVRILEPALRAIELERAQSVQAWEELLGDPAHAERLLGVGGNGSLLYDTGQLIGLRLWQVGPSHHDLGWYLYQSQIQTEACREAISEKSYRPLRQHILSVPEPPWVYLMSRIIHGSHEPFFYAMFRNQVRLEIAVTAIALHRFRARHGQFPGSLEELVPDLLVEVPTDWMDGKSLRYQRKTPAEFRLWSVGKDGIDQGGDPHPPKGIPS